MARSNHLLRLNPSQAKEHEYRTTLHRAAASKSTHRQSAQTALQSASWSCLAAQGETGVSLADRPEGSRASLWRSQRGIDPAWHNTCDLDLARLVGL